MLKITIDAIIKEKCPEMRLGCIHANIEVQATVAGLWEAFDSEMALMTDGMTNADIHKRSTVAAARQAYKSLGKDPSRYRPSAEALLRRLLSGKELYQVNNVVDLINWMSLRTGFSIGGYDVSAIQGAISHSVGLESDEYEGLGRGLLNITNLPVLRDELGAFGCPTSDSTRTGIQLHTTSCLWVYYDFGGDAALQKAMEDSVILMEKFAGGKDFEMSIME
jgi:DNA/RNA-binding domain of Phe-tRNA-synthetase-like protein